MTDTLISVFIISALLAVVVLVGAEVVRLAQGCAI